jgi:hypothetical protein
VWRERREKRVKDLERKREVWREEKKEKEKQIY